MTGIVGDCQGLSGNSGNSGITGDFREFHRGFHRISEELQENSTFSGYLKFSGIIRFILMMSRDFQFLDIFALPKAKGK